MNIAHGMQRHRRAPNPLNWLNPRFSPTAPGFGGGDTNSSPPNLGGITATSSPTSTPSTSSSTSSTSSSSSSSSTSPSTTSTTSLSTSSSSSSSSSTPVPVTPSKVKTTPTNTEIYKSAPYSNTLTATSVISSSTSSAAPTPAVSTGALIGGIAAGILGVAGIAFAIMYFVRRWNRDADDSHFDSDVFRRQSVMLQDDEPRSPSRGQGRYTPRPPTMIQRHIDNATPISPMGSQHGYPYQQGDYNIQYNNPGYNSPGFQPGQVVTAANPFYSPYGDSPMGSPAMVAPYDSAYNPHGDLARQPSHPAYLSRQPSPGPPPPGPLPPVGNNTSDAHYVDLARSSVTPFQAAQYEEISRHLDSTAPPSMLSAITEVDSQEHPPFGDPIKPPSPAHVSSNPPSHPELPAGPVSPIKNQFNPLAKSADSPAAPAAAYVADGGKRPDTVYTLYDDDDAYGGI